MVAGWGGSIFINQASLIQPFWVIGSMLVFTDAWKKKKKKEGWGLLSAHLHVCHKNRRAVGDKSTEMKVEVPYHISNLKQFHFLPSCSFPQRMSVCVCVCVCQATKRREVLDFK